MGLAELGMGPNPVTTAYDRQVALNNQQGLNQIQQATGVVTLMQHLQAQQQAAKIRDAMARGGGDLNATIKLALQAGVDPAAVGHFAPLMKVMEEAKTNDLLRSKYGGAQSAAVTPAPTSTPAGPGDINFLAANNEAMGLPPPQQVPAQPALNSRQMMAKQYRDRADALEAPLAQDRSLTFTEQGARIGQEISRLRAEADRADPTARPQAMGTTRIVQDKAEKITQELQQDGTWKEIARGPAFANQVAPERLIPVMRDGKPTLVPQSQAAGLTPATAQTVVNVNNAIPASNMAGTTTDQFKAMSWDDLARKTKAPISGEALRLGSLQLALTGQMPQMGMGGKGTSAQVRVAVMEGRAKVAADLGVTPEEMIGMPASWKADAGALVKQTAKRDAVGAIVNSFHNNIATFESVAEGKPPQLAGDRIAALGNDFKKIDFTNVKALNDLQLAVKRQFNDPATVAYVTAAVTVAMDYARILSSQGMSAAQVTDSAREEAMKLISVGFNKTARQALIGTLESDTAGQVKGMEDQITNIRRRMGTPIQAPTPAAPSGVPTATGPNGQKLYLRNGQWQSQ